MEQSIDQQAMGRAPKGLGPEIQLLRDALLVGFPRLFCNFSQ